jgi:hypothetical protein
VNPWVLVDSTGIDAMPKVYGPFPTWADAKRYLRETSFGEHADEDQDVYIVELEAPE